MKADHAQLWDRARNELEAKIPAAFFETFIRPLRVEFDGKDLALVAPDERSRELVDRRYLPLINETLAEGAMAGQVRVRSSSIPTQLTQHEEQTTPAPALRDDDGLLAPVIKREIESFLFGRGGSALFLHGPEGSGKTTLAHAMARAARDQGRSARLLTLEEFLTEFALACQERRTIDWRQKLRAHDLIVIDDLHYLKGQATRAQEELRNMLDALPSTGGQIVFLSTRMAGALRQLSPDLLSRLTSLREVAPGFPSAKSRAALLRRLLAEEGVSLDSRLIDWLARRIERDLRRLRSASMRLAYHRRVHAIDVWDQSLVEQVCADLFSNAPRISPADLLREVASFFGVTAERVLAGGRDRQLVLARHLTAYLCTEKLGLTCKDAAEAIGLRDHGSVLHARKKISELMATDLFFKQQVDGLLERLHNT